VAEALSWSCRKLCRIESGRRWPCSDDLRRLMAEYQVDDAESAAIVAMACDSGQQEQTASPAHRLIAEDLRRKIDSGELGHGSPLPTELELRNEYGVSRHTVRNAVRWLKRRGLIETRPGQGTFVVDEPGSLVTSHTKGLENPNQGEDFTCASASEARVTRPAPNTRHIDLQPWAALAEFVAQFDLIDLCEPRFLIVTRQDPEPSPESRVRTEMLLESCSIFSGFLRELAAEAAQAEVRRILTVFLAVQSDSETPKQMQPLALPDGLTRAGLPQRLPARAWGSSPGLLAPVQLSPETSLYDRKTGSGQSLRKPDRLPVSCLNRGMVAA
jgi:DNA-binding transcriptional regulator YhcF (GntR family)